MLARRVATAIVLLAILLPTIFIDSPMPWGVLTLAFLGAAAWEWARLLPAAGSPWKAAAIVVGLGAVGLGWRLQAEWPVLPLKLLVAGLVLFWICIGPLRLRRHDSHQGGWVLAVLLLFGCWLALYELRVRGAVPLLSSLMVVWVADIAAYFCGRAWGRRKLAPAISPGKSWEGAVGGAMAVVTVSVVIANIPALSESLQAILLGRSGLAIGVMGLIAITALSIVGDLHESLLKRQAGVKDSSQLLPGHGGVLDRIDALIPAMPAALLIYLVLT